MGAPFTFILIEHNKPRFITNNSQSFIEPSYIFIFDRFKNLGEKLFISDSCWKTRSVLNLLLLLNNNDFSLLASWRNFKNVFFSIFPMLRSSSEFFQVHNVQWILFLIYISLVKSHINQSWVFSDHHLITYFF